MFILHVLDEFYPCLTTSLEVGCNLKSRISMMQDPWGSALIQTRVIPSRIFRNIPHKNIQKYFQMSSQKQTWLSMYLIKRKKSLFILRLRHNTRLIKCLNMNLIVLVTKSDLLVTFRRRCFATVLAVSVTNMNFMAFLMLVIDLLSTSHRVTNKFCLHHQSPTCNQQSCIVNKD